MPFLSFETYFAVRALDRIKSMIAYWDRDLRCRYANRASLAWFGKEAEQVIGSTLEALLGPELFALDESHARAALAGNPQVFERRLSGFDDPRERVCLLRFDPDIVDGEVHGFVVEVTGVDDTRSLEAALQAEIALKQRRLLELDRKEAALEVAQALGRMGSWEWEIAADITTWSAGLYRLFGLNPALLPPSFSEHARLYTSESWARLQAVVDAAVTRGEPYAIELQYLRGDGTSGWMEARGDVERDSKGTVVGLHGTAQDCTERHHLLAALQAQAQQYESALDLARIGLWEWNTDSDGFELQNQRARAIFGIDPDASGTLQAHDFLRQRMHVEDVEGFMKACSNVIENPTEIFAFTGRLVRDPPERYAWIHCTGRVTGPKQDGRTLRGTVIDMSEQIGDDKALLLSVPEWRAADERKSAFLYALAHELRNCISPVAGGLQLLQKPLASTSYQKIGDIMGRQIAHMTRLVDDVYDMRRIESGEFELRLGKLSLNDVVFGAIDMCTSKIAHGKHRLDTVLPPHDVIMSGDGTRLTQCLVNLISNACKFTPPGGDIRVALEVTANGSACMSVSDSGVGLAPDDLDSIFDLYVQAGVGETRSGAGLGIGLHLVKQMVSLHGGTVHAASEGIGKGATVTIRLPLQ